VAFLQQPLLFGLVVHLLSLVECLPVAIPNRQFTPYGPKSSSLLTH
jgi:hypothetical protein